MSGGKTSGIRGHCRQENLRQNETTQTRRYAFHLTSNNTIEVAVFLPIFVTLFTLQKNREFTSSVPFNFWGFYAKRMQQKNWQTQMSFKLTNEL